MRQAPFASWPIYRSPDYIEPAGSDPLYIHEWEDLREQCRIALERRREIYPAWIEAGRISAEIAAADITAWEQLHAQWTWIINGPESGSILPDLLSLYARTCAVDLALSRVEQEIARGRRSAELELQRHLNQALRWHLDREQRGDRTAAFYADLNRAIGADRAARGLPPSAVRVLGPDHTDASVLA